MKTTFITAFTCAISLQLFSAPAPRGKLVAHEWGTFTSVQGSDGEQIQWNPFTKTDLPRFVYSRAVLTGQGGKSVALKEAMMSYVRMETPVIYFYSDTGLSADVTVEMPQGRITEWYPRATRVGPAFTTNKAEAKEASRSLIEWKGVTILPRDTTEISDAQLIREPGGNHYYDAREVDANFLRVASPHAPGGAEYERDLFYRGIGYFKAPLTVEMPDESHVRVSTKSTAPMTDLFVLTIREGRASYEYLERLDSSAARHVKLNRTAPAPLGEVRTRLMEEMAAVLVKQGLYLKEARAMVNTWKDQWFSEEGTRVLYLLPRAWTDQALPLTISPAPSEVVRVMVGRAELITPEIERELRNEVTRYSQGDRAAKTQAIANVRKLGVDRFLEPAMRRMLGGKSSKEFAQIAWKLASEASRATTSTEPTTAALSKAPAL